MNPVRFKALYFTPVVLALVLAAAGCRPEPAAATAPSEGRRFIVSAPAGSSRQILSPDQEPAESSDDLQPEDTPVPRVMLQDNSIRLSVMNENLDADQMDEQLILTKGRNAEQDKIRIIVVDFDTVRNAYYITWQGTTGATDSKNISLRFADVTGDHNLEIVFMGMTGDGFQTLDIYRKTQSPSGFGLYYIPIASLSLEGTIEIVEAERSPAYELEQKNGQSYPVVAYTRDPDDPNGIDLIKTTYYWKYQDNAYVPGNMEKVPGRHVQEKHLQEVLQDETVTSFEKHLEGPWLLSSAEKRDTLSPGDIILFEPKTRKITFYAKDIQEIYNWESSRKNIFRGLSIESKNESINSIQRTIRIALQTVDTITVDVNGNEQWTGLYKRLSPEIQRSMIIRQESSASTSRVTLSGLYKNEKDVEMNFQYPDVEILENGKRLRGGYALYAIGKDILEIRILKENGLVAEARTYIVEYGEEKDETKITRVVKITPARVSILGAETLGKTSMRLEQIEILEKESGNAAAGIPENTDIRRNAGSSVPVSSRSDRK